MSLDALRRGDLAGARSLRLGGGLTEFPREIFGLADTLEVLDLGGNALSDLPADMGRLGRLRVLFCSGNRFARLPPSLGDCPALSQIGFRGSGLREIPGESLPLSLRWLTVTDNALESLPDALGQRPALQKLMLAGNRLTALPETLAAAPRLELLRLSANRFAALPGWLADLPRLAWLAWAGNPLDEPVTPMGQAIAWGQLRTVAVLGEGASGLVHRAVWQGPEGPRDVALKLFKGRMTSDGLPDREMAACLAAGAHPNLTYALGRLTAHPAAIEGLVMPLLPAHWRVLAGPPSPESCSRDVYDPALRLDLGAVRRIARGVGGAAAHLHARGLLHGDLYAHNILWDGAGGESVLSDFGAASFLPAGFDLRRIEVLAWGILLGELLDHCAEAAPGLRAIQRLCVACDPAARPLMAEAIGSIT